MVRRVQRIKYSQTGLLETSLKVFIVTDNAAYGFHYMLTSHRSQEEPLCCCLELSFNGMILVSLNVLVFFVADKGLYNLVHKRWQDIYLVSGFSSCRCN